MFTLIKQMILESIKMKNSNSIALLFLLIGIMILEQNQYIFASILFSLSAGTWAVVFYLSHHKAKNVMKKKSNPIIKNKED